MSKYPNAFYRVSIKAVIRNDQGHVLLVKEHIDDWVLPGGGLDHGEDPETALRRELKEELAVNQVLVSKLLSTYTFYATRKEAWYMWLLYDVEIDSFDAEAAPDISEAAYVDINSFLNSENKAERHIYKAIAGEVSE